MFFRMWYILIKVTALTIWRLQMVGMHMENGEYLPWRLTWSHSILIPAVTEALVLLLEMRVDAVDLLFMQMQILKVLMSIYLTEKTYVLHHCYYCYYCYYSFFNCLLCLLNATQWPENNIANKIKNIKYCNLYLHEFNRLIAHFVFFNARGWKSSDDPVCTCVSMCVCVCVHECIICGFRGKVAVGS